MLRWLWLLLLSVVLSSLIPYPSSSVQDRWLLRFTPPQGLTLRWQIRMATKRFVNDKAKTETTELLVLESVDEVRPNGHLVWSSRALRCIINGEVIPSGELEATVSEITPLGYPAKPTVLPPPTLDSLDDWLEELFGGVALVFPPTEVGIGQTWAHQIAIGLKPPNEPRRLRIAYRLDGREAADGADCFRITVQTRSPVRLAWQMHDASVIITGGAKLDGVFWFDPKLGAVRRRRADLSINYMMETERWDGFQFVQRTKFVNRTTTLEAKLVAL